FGINLFGQIHRALHIGEEHGHLFALAFESRARRQNLLGEMLRGICAWIGARGRTAAPEWLTTRVAEFRRRRNLCAAAGATQRETRSALETEARACRVRVTTRGAVHSPSSFATLAARIGAPISTNKR